MTTPGFPSEPNPDPYGTPQGGVPPYPGGGVPPYPGGGVPPYPGGAMPYAPPVNAGEYGRPGAGAVGPIEIGPSIKFGWEAFKANPGPWLVWVLISVALSVVANQLPTLVSSLASLAVSILVGAIGILGAVAAVEGRRLSISEFLAGTSHARFGAVLVTSLLVSVIETIGFILLIIPGLIAVVLLSPAVFLAATEDLKPVDALKRSYQVASANVGGTILFLLALLGINILGALLIGLGLLVSIPVSVIAASYAFRKAAGHTLALQP